MNTRSATAPHLAAPLLAPVSAALHRVLARLQAVRRRRALDAELSGLTDRELADIGMRRAVSPDFAHGLPFSLHL